MATYIYQTFKYFNYDFLIFADQDKHNHALSNSMSAEGKKWVATQAGISLTDLEMPTYKSNQSRLPRGDTIEASSPKKNTYSFTDRDNVIKELKKEKKAEERRQAAAEAQRLEQERRARLKKKREDLERVVAKHERTINGLGELQCEALMSGDDKAAAKYSAQRQKAVEAFKKERDAVQRQYADL